MRESAHVYYSAHVEIRRQFVELILPFYHVGPMHRTRIVKFGDDWFYLLNIFPTWHVVTIIATW